MSQGGAAGARGGLAEASGTLHGAPHPLPHAPDSTSRSESAVSESASSSSPRGSLRMRGSTRSLRPRQSMLSMTSSVDEGSELDELLANLERSPYGESLSRNAVKRRDSHRSLSRQRSVHSLASGTSGDADEERWCCCGRETCEVAQRNAQRLANLEMDLHLSAEIGQALLQRQDALVQRAQQDTEEHEAQRNQLIDRLAESVRENQALEWKLGQAHLDLESSDHAHRALLAELEEARLQAKRANTRADRLHDAERRAAEAEERAAAAEARAEAAEKRAAARKRTSEERAAPVPPPAVEERSEVLSHTTELLETLCARLATLERGSSAPTEELVRVFTREHETLRSENSRIQAAHEAAVAQIAQLQQQLEAQEELGAERTPRSAGAPLLAEELEDVRGNAAPATRTNVEGLPQVPAAPTPAALSSPRSEVLSDRTSSRQGHTEVTAPSEGEFVSPGSPAKPTGSVRTRRSDDRTLLLPALLTAAQRAAGGVMHANVDELSARLRRQRLSGDVAHLTRAAVHAARRDVEMLRDQFRQQLEREAPGATAQSGEQSIVARRDFVALLKLLRDVLLELVRLRAFANEVQLNPASAAQLLQEHLGVDMREYLGGGMSGWFSRVLSLGQGPPPASPPTSAPPAGVRAFSAPVIQTPVSAPAAAPQQRGPLPQRLMPRAGVPAAASPVAVQVRGSQAAAVPSQHSAAPASRILRHQASAAYMRGSGPKTSVGTAVPVAPRRLRPRGLSDSSIQSTFVEHGGEVVPDEAVDDQ